MKKYIFLIVFLSLLPPAFVSAAIYSWTDSNGELNITDDLSKVPFEYRDQVTTMETEPVVRDAKVGSVKEKEKRKVKDPEIEIYGDHPLAWWRLKFEKLRSEVDSAKKELANKEQFIEVFRRGRRLGQRNKPEDIETYYKYKTDISIIKKRIRINKRKLEDLKRRAKFSGVPKKVR